MMKKDKNKAKRGAGKILREDGSPPPTIDTGSKEEYRNAQWVEAAAVCVRRLDVTK
jgi:hypothetical protein